MFHQDLVPFLGFIIDLDWLQANPEKGWRWRRLIKLNLIARCCVLGFTLIVTYPTSQSEQYGLFPEFYSRERDLPKQSQHTKKDLRHLINKHCHLWLLVLIPVFYICLSRSIACILSVHTEPCFLGADWYLIRFSFPFTILVSSLDLLQVWFLITRYRPSNIF